LTAKTTETRYRDPLRTPDAPSYLQKVRAKQKTRPAAETAVKRKSHKVFDSKGKRD
jgi:hypothetical protein